MPRSVSSGCLPTTATTAATVAAAVGASATVVAGGGWPEPHGSGSGGGDAAADAAEAAEAAEAAAIFSDSVGSGRAVPSAGAITSGNAASGGPTGFALSSALSGGPLCGALSFGSVSSLSHEPSDTLDFVGVFDGHGGFEASAHCAARMHRHLADALGGEAQPSEQHGGQQQQQQWADSLDAEEHARGGAQQQQQQRLAAAAGAATIFGGAAAGNATRSAAGAAATASAAGAAATRGAAGAAAVSSSGAAGDAAGPSATGAAGASTGAAAPVGGPSTPPAIAAAGSGGGGNVGQEEPLERAHPATGSGDPQQRAHRYHATGSGAPQPRARTCECESDNFSSDASVSPAAATAAGGSRPCIRPMGETPDALAYVSLEFDRAAVGFDAIEEALRCAFLRTDAEFAAECADVAESVGSTAVVALVGARKLWVANCGDSRAVLRRGGAVVPLTDDHKPERVDEAVRS
ncbi:hypothetical protein FOA52_000981 [Chlamydomonas sp. UWO 241]|nr:hypothetical protein FOA52_000981 [Chlamydomonas sp. UWO 241]